MPAESPIFPRLWKFVASSVASVTFVLSIFLFLQGIVLIVTGDLTFSASRDFWNNFGSSSFAKLFVGLSLATFAFTEFSDHLLARFYSWDRKNWFRHSMSYFVSFFTIVLLSATGLFVAQFPNFPWTYSIAFLVLIFCVAISAISYGFVASRKIHL